MCIRPSRPHVGAWPFHRCLRLPEVIRVLNALALEAERTGEPLGLGPPEELRAWVHARLNPVTYERLELMEDDGQPVSDDKGAKERGLRGAQLWVGLARAALMANVADATSHSAPTPPTEPSVIA